MGSGKSVVGKILAARLGWKFIDTDTLIEKNEGRKISDIFAQNGEPYFRDAESMAVKEVSEMSNAVVSCGGGVVLRPANMDLLEKNSFVVCLQASPETIYERTKTGKDRPLLQVPDPVKKIKELLGARKEFYKRCLFEVKTDNLNQEQVADAIIAAYKSRVTSRAL